MDTAVEALIETLVPEITRVLGADLVGLYLYGSAVSGGFEPGVSDVDLVAVTARPPERLDLAELAGVHDALEQRSPEWTDRVEVVYVGRGALRFFRTTAEPLAVVSPGEPLHLRDERIIEWLQNWYLVRETAITLAGPQPTTLIPPIDRDEFLGATARYAGQLGEQDLATVAPTTLAYVVLTICRAAITLRTREPVSKGHAAERFVREMPEWAEVVDEAREARRSNGERGFSSAESRGRAVELVRSVGATIAADARDRTG
jgi:Domain of unknown function (DUF4111)/Nucleotidyltransferase domain